MSLCNKSKKWPLFNHIALALVIFLGSSGIFWCLHKELQFNLERTIHRERSLISNNIFLASKLSKSNNKNFTQNFPSIDKIDDLVKNLSESAYKIGLPTKSLTIEHRVGAVTDIGFIRLTMSFMANYVPLKNWLADALYKNPSLILQKLIIEGNSPSIDEKEKIQVVFMFFVKT